MNPSREQIREAAKQYLLRRVQAEQKKEGIRKVEALVYGWVQEKRRS